MSSDDLSGFSLMDLFRSEADGPTVGRIGPDLKAAGVTVATTRGAAVAVVGDAASAASRSAFR